ncbi:hypothetical protein MMC07_005042 [Pseudocyphellaria aurata]|nr:hypothetical protein [Pseudocyphellaria aurata]
MSDQAADPKKPGEEQPDPASTSTDSKEPSENGQKQPSARSGKSFPPLSTSLTMTLQTNHHSPFSHVDAFLGSYGNAAGSKINSALSPVGAPVGKGLETATRPVGNVVDAVVGGVLRFGGASGEAAGVGAGNMDLKNDAETERLREPLGGEEQTGQNPLGLRGGGK